MFGTRNPVQKFTTPLILMTLLFFMWGLLTSLNDILIPHLKSIYHLDYAKAMLVQFCFFGAYALTSIPMSFVVKKLGYKISMICGLLITSVGCLTFIPAAHLAFYWLFLFGFFVLASGIVLLQVAANPYVTLLGDPERASSRLTFAQAMNSLGTTVGPYFGGLMILAVPVLTRTQLVTLSIAEYEKYRTTIIDSIQTPYLILFFSLIFIAIFLSLFRMPKFFTKKLKKEKITNRPLPRQKKIWQYPQLLLGAIAIFMYVGVEVAIGSFIVNYLGLPQIAYIQPEQAADYVSVYWGTAMIGRFIGAWVLKKIAPAIAVAFNAMVSMVLLMVTILFSGHISMWSLLILGFFNSIQFPTIFSLAIENLGALTSYGSGILCTAIVGGAVIPELQGILADYIGVQNSFVLGIFCYGYILFYGVWIFKRKIRF